MPLAQFGDSVLCCVLAVWHLALFPSRSLAPCAVPLSQPDALRYPASHHLAPSAVCCYFNEECKLSSVL
eukprot:3665735-Pleurochrysis_carterae.AAC.1